MFFYTGTRVGKNLALSATGSSCCGCVLSIVISGCGWILAIESRPFDKLNSIASISMPTLCLTCAQRQLLRRESSRQNRKINILIYVLMEFLIKIHILPAISHRFRLEKPFKFTIELFFREELKFDAQHVLWITKCDIH